MAPEPAPDGSSFLPGILKSTCYIDVRWFPFDVQKCDLKFGSWTHNGWLLDLQMMDVDISTYIPNGEWDLVGEGEPDHTPDKTRFNELQRTASTERLKQMKTTAFIDSLL